jgi:hypothetical protein
VRSGLTGWYVGDSYNATLNQWRDISGSNNHGTTSGTITFNSQAINGEDFINGGTAAKVTLPQAFSGADYTFFHVTRCAQESKRLQRQQQSSHAALSGLATPLRLAVC